MDTTELLGAINEQHGTRFELVGRFAGGEGTGATEIVDADGSRWVLKASEGDGIDYERAASTTARLRDLGYPAPATRVTGEHDGLRFGITDRLPGAPLSELDDAQVEHVIALVELQTGVGIPPDRPWPEWLATTVVDGHEGFCEHASLRAHSTETASLLDGLRRIAGAAASVETPTDDVVHFDFAAPNMLANDGIVTGIIDWEMTQTGDAAFDLVTQALYAYQPHRRDRFLGAARERTHPDAVQLYAAHMALRQVDWTLRHHEPVVAEFFIALSRDLLAACGIPAGFSEGQAGM